MLFSSIVLNAVILALLSIAYASPIEERSPALAKQVLKLQKDKLVTGLTSFSAVLRLTTAPTDAEVVKFASAGYKVMGAAAPGPPGSMLALQPRNDPLTVSLSLPDNFA